MKRLCIVGLFSIIVLTSCSSQVGYKYYYQYYDAQLGSKYVSSEIMSNLMMIEKCDDSFLMSNFAFIIAQNSSIDLEREDYFLLCPLSFEMKVVNPSLNELQLYNSVYFNKEKLVEFINVLKRIILEWDKELEANEGKFYDFAIHEKVNIIRSKEIGSIETKVNIQTNYDYEFSAEYQKFKIKASLDNDEKISNELYINGRNFDMITITQKKTVQSLIDILEIALAELPDEKILDQ